jgi:hypothetical protein
MVTPTTGLDVSPAALTFTAANFSTPQSVNVVGVSSGARVVRLSTPGAPDRIVSVTVLAPSAPVCLL